MVYVITFVAFIFVRFREISLLHYRCNFLQTASILGRRPPATAVRSDKSVPRFVTVVRSFYLRQKCCGSRRLAGGASKSEMAPADKSSSPEPPNRKTGDGCPSCGHPSTRYNSPNADCTSSCCSSQCRHPRASRRTPDCQPCALKSILKKRCLPNCYQCNASRGCLCQSMPRGCKCSLPIQVDAHATYECSCDCSSRPECVCPPSERRCLRKTVKCPNARPCYCPCPQLPKCYCPHYQPSPCGPCASPKYRRPLRFKDLCSPCPFCPPCRPVSTTSSCRPPTPQKKLTFCTGRSDRPSSFCTGQSWCGIIDDKSSESSVCSERSDNQRRELHERNRDCCYATGSDNGFKCTNQSHNLLNEGSTQNPTFINLSIILNLSKSVDPDSRDMPEGRDETVFENAKEENALEGCIVEKSSQDS